MSIGSFPLGSAAIGGEVDFDVGAEIVTATVTIDGNAINYKTGSITIQDTLEGRSTCSFTLVEFAPPYLHAPLGETVEVWWNLYLLFAGTIDSTEEEIQGNSTTLFTKIKCVDWNQLCDRFFVSAAYTSKTISYIVNDLVTIQTPLSTEGITQGTIATTPTITEATFNFKKLTDVFNELSELTGNTWNITPYKVLNFFDRATFDAPFDIGDSYKMYRNLTYKRNRSQYRNREIFRAGKDFTDARTEYFRGDSAATEPSKRRRTFNTAYPLGTAPTITKNGSAQRVGIKGIDKDGDLTISGWKQWFYQYDSNEISQNSKSDEVNNPTLTETDILEVTYQGLFPIVIFEEDESEIKARIAVEGGSGVYEFVDEDDSIDGRDPANEKALRYLAIYGRLPGILEYETDLVGLQPGHLQTITLAEHGISATQFMVDEIRITFPSNNYPIFEITALDCETQQGWSKFWRKLARQGRTFTIRENEIVEKSIRPTETLSWTDVIKETVHDIVTLPAYTDDPYTFAMVGEVTVPVTGEKVPMAICGRSRIGNPYGS